MAKSKKKEEVVETPEVIEESTAPQETVVLPVDEVIEVAGEKVELTNVTVTETILELNPDMQDEGLKVGDVIQIATTEEGDAKLAASVEEYKEPLSPDAARWSKYLNGVKQTAAQVLAKNPNHPQRKWLEEIIAKG